MNTVNVRNIVIGEGIPKICVPIVGKTKEELLSEVAVLKGSAVDVVEWRMDWFEAVETVQAAVDMLQVLREALPDLPILATFRSKKEGGEREVSTAYYVELNKAIIDCKAADLIDVELFTGEKEVKELIAYAHAAGVRVIMSNPIMKFSHACRRCRSWMRIFQRLLLCRHARQMYSLCCRQQTICMKNLRIVPSSRCLWQEPVSCPDCAERSLVLR